MTNATNNNITQDIIPAIHINHKQHKLARGFVAANRALQLFQLHSTMKANLPEELVGVVIDNTTGDSLEFCHLIKQDKYRGI